MRDRYLSLVATIATSALIACSDAAVDSVTAPVPAAKPAQPVADLWPTQSEYAENEIPGAIGITIDVQASFQDDYKLFVATGWVHFTWANDVSATVNASLINRNGATVNSGSASIQYSRLALPVPEGDTVLTVQLSTNGITCGLVGKSVFSGHASQKALDAKLVQITLYSKTIGPTNGPDVMQPECPPEPPPSGGGDDDFEICYTVWRELWIWDYLSRTYTLDAEWVVGSFCILYSALT